MVSLDAIADRILSPVFFSIACFLVFALVFMIGVATGYDLIMFSSLGFFIAGGSIFALYVVNRWVLGNTDAPFHKYPAQKTETRGGETDGTKRSDNKFQAVIEV